MSNWIGTGATWVELLLRWFHIIAGITWLGSTWFFQWLEKRILEGPVADAPNIKGRAWMVHGGGFYLMEKQQKPELMPRKLHWFKWESMLTFISGVLLLLLVFYYGGLLTTPDARFGFWPAVGIGLGLLVVAWPVYDLACRLLRGRDVVLMVVGFIAIVALAWALRLVLSARAAFFHIGAMFGTIMVLNVWIRILPGQQKMLDAVAAGREPDLSLGAEGGRRSKHNTFLAIPLILIMVSNHYSTITYGHPYGWAVLGGLIVVGWVFAWAMRNRP